MAILMVYDRDNKHEDPDKDQRGCYKRGYIVQVFEDTQKLELPPKEPFLFIKVKGVPTSDFETRATSQETISEEIENEEKEIEIVPTTIRRREYKFDFETLPKEAIDALNKNRYWETGEDILGLEILGADNTVATKKEPKEVTNKNTKDILKFIKHITSDVTADEFDKTEYEVDKEKYIAKKAAEKKVKEK